jgi:hypothetical protein
MRNRQVFLIGLGILALWLGVVRTAWADAYTYTAVRKQIRVGVLQIGSHPVLTPFVWHVLDRRTDYKPAGWDFVNPLAGPGSRKNMAPYWVVNLDQISMEDLRKFDALVVATQGSNIGFTPEQREKLRKFVDAGGLLWIDNQTAYTIDTRAPLFLDLQFNDEGSTNGLLAYPTHPLVNAPYPIGVGEINRMGAGIRGSLSAVGADWNAPPAPAVLAPIVVRQDNRRPVLVAGQYGSGAVVVSSIGIAYALSHAVAPPGVPVANENFVAAAPQNLKFGYNMIQWASAFTAQRKNARRTSGTFESIGAPLVEKWGLTGLQAVGTFASAPVFYNGALFVVGSSPLGGLRLYCFDANPRRDLDGDGNEDDGLPDLWQRGTPYDEVWEAPLGSEPVSTPQIVEVPTSSSDPLQRALVVVALKNGSVQAYRAFPRTGGINAPIAGLSDGSNLVWERTLPNAVPFDGDNVPVPAFAEGLIVVPAVQSGAGGNNGRLYVLWAATGDVLNSGSAGQDWIQPRTNLPPIRGGVTLGYVQDRGQTGEGSIASDLMAYVSTAPSSTAGTLTSSVYAFWLGTKGEVLSNPNNDKRTFVTRAQGRQLHIFLADSSSPYTALNPVVWVYNRQSDGSLVLVDRYDLPDSRVTVNAGTIVFTSQPTTNPVVVMNYFIDWGKSPGTPIRSTVGIADIVPNPSKTIMEQPALDANDNVIYTTDNGSIYALLEQPGNRTVMRWRWQLHNGYTDQITPQQSITVPPSLVLKHTLFGTPLPPGSEIGLTPGGFTAPPAVFGDTTYAVAEARGTFPGIPFPISGTVLMAFDNNPKVELRLRDGNGNPVSLPANATLQIRQVDVIRSAGGTTQYTYVQPAQYSVNRAGGVITIHNMMPGAGGGGAIFAFSLSQPTLVVVTAGSEPPRQYFIQPIEYSNLKWFMFIPAVRVKASPVVAGDVVYLSAQVDAPGVQVSTVIAVSADPTATDPSIQKGDDVPLLTQDSDKPNHVLWPALGKPSDYGYDPNNPATWGPSLTNLLTATLNELRRAQVGTQGIAAVAASNGLLAAVGDTGIKVFERQMTLIADSHRLLEMDPGGKVAWSLDASKLWGAASGGSAPVVSVTPTSVARPARVYRTGANEMIVVDTGNNRIVWVDKAGNVTSELRRFENPPRLNLSDPSQPPAPLAPGDPHELREPQDVSVYTEYVPREANGNRLNPFEDAQPLEFWVHYLIADTGNGRLVDVIDRYAADSTTGAVGPLIAARQLFWTSAEGAERRKYRYTGVQRIVSGYRNGAPVFTLVATVANYRVRPDGTGEEGVGGTVMVRTIGGGLDITEAFSEVLLPNEPLGSNNRVPIGSPNSVQVYPVRYDSGTGEVVYHIVLATDKGVFDLERLAPNQWRIRWRLTDEVYRSLTHLRDRIRGPQPVDTYISRAIPLWAVSAVRLSNGHYLICNAYRGVLPDSSRFNGEVFEIDPSNYNPGATRTENEIDGPHTYLTDGMRPEDIVWWTPRRVKSWANVSEVVSSDTYRVDTPFFADRPF